MQESSHSNLLTYIYYTISECWHHINKKPVCSSRAIHCASYIQHKMCFNMSYSECWHHINKKPVCSRAIHCASYIQHKMCFNMSYSECWHHINKKPVCSRAIHCASYIQHKMRFNMSYSECWHHINKKPVCSRAIHAPLIFNIRCVSICHILNAGITLTKNPFVVAQFTRLLYST